MKQARDVEQGVSGTIPARGGIVYYSIVEVKTRVEVKTQGRLDFKIGPKFKPRRAF